jgi:hypothetical protein
VAVTTVIGVDGVVDAIGAERVVTLAAGAVDVVGADAAVVDGSEAHAAQPIATTPNTPTHQRHMWAR